MDRNLMDLMMESKGTSKESLTLKSKPMQLSNGLMRQDKFSWD
jgi:hypothetical protein